VNIQSSFSPLQAGLSGVTRGLEALQEIASDISQAGTSQSEGLETTADLTQSLADLQAQKNATLAAAKVVTSADDVLGTLLDVNA